jgi:ABC-type glycerol-3-phosphate transport system substrate-binding protein
MARTTAPRSRSALVLLGALVIPLAGCGGGGGGGGAAGGGADDGALTVLHYYDEGAGGLTDLLPVWEERYESANPEVDVQFEYVAYDQMQSKVISAAAAGEGWDVILPAGVWLPEMVKAGAVAPIDEQWSAFADAELFPDNTQSAGIVDGERYAVQPFTNVEGIFYNKTILDEIGVAVPTNLDELDAAMAAAKAAGYNAFSTAAPPGAGGEFNLVPWLVSNGWTYEEADAPGALEILTRLQGWRDQGYFSANDASGFNAEKNFATGEYAFVQGGNWNLSSFATDLDFEWGAAVIDGIDAALLGGEIMAVGALSDDPQAAFDFIAETYLSAEGGLEVAGAGSIPLRSDLADAPEVTSDPNLVAFATIASQSIGNPTTENTGKVSDVVGGAFNEFVAGTLDAQGVADALAQDVPPLLAD